MAADSDSVIVSRRALGRGVGLGSLYDLRRDQISGGYLYQTDAKEFLACKTILPTQELSYQFEHSSSTDNRFNNLNVEAELKVSVLAGLFKLEGSGKYLTEEIKSSNVARGAVICTYKGYTEDLNILDSRLKSCLLIEAFNGRATHIIHRIVRGANVIVQFEQKTSEHSKKVEISGKLKAALKKIAVSVSGKAAVDYSEKEKDFLDSFSFRIFGDISFPENTPQSINEALAFIRTLPKEFAKQNLPAISFDLYPLSALKTTTQVQSVQLVRQLDALTFREVEKLNKEYVCACQHFNDVHETVRSLSSVMPDDLVLAFREFEDEVVAFMGLFHEKVQCALVKYRSMCDGSEANPLSAVIGELRKCPSSPHAIERFLSEWELTITPARNTYGFLVNLDIPLLSRNESLLPFLSSPTLFVLLMSPHQSSHPLYIQTCSRFLSLKRERKESQFLLIDFSIRPEFKTEKPTIRMYGGGRVIDDDYVQNVAEKSEDFVRPDSWSDVSLERVDSIGFVALQVRCPNSIVGKCPVVVRSWVCVKCNDVMKVTPSNGGLLMCKCGCLPISKAQFRCSHSEHGDFLSFPLDAIPKIFK